MKCSHGAAPPPWHAIALLRSSAPSPSIHYPTLAPPRTPPAPTSRGLWPGSWLPPAARPSPPDRGQRVRPCSPCCPSLTLLAGSPRKGWLSAASKIFKPYSINPLSRCCPAVKRGEDRAQVC